MKLYTLNRKLFDPDCCWQAVTRRVNRLAVEAMERDLFYGTSDAARGFYTPDVKFVNGKGYRITTGYEVLHPEQKIILP